MTTEYKENAGGSPGGAGAGPATEQAPTGTPAWMAFREVARRLEELNAAVGEIKPGELPQLRTSWTKEMIEIRLLAATTLSLAAAEVGEFLVADPDEITYVEIRPCIGGLCMKVYMRSGIIYDVIFSRNEGKFHVSGIDVESVHAASCSCS